LRTVTVEDLRRVVRTYLDPQTETLVTVGR
jgi:predicted Zn-dependent peptidase